MQQHVQPSHDWAQREFKKSSFSPTSTGDCVEIAMRPGVVAVRDSKQSFSAGPIIECTAEGWGALRSHLRTSKF